IAVNPRDGIVQLSTGKIRRMHAAPIRSQPFERRTAEMSRALSRTTGRLAIALTIALAGSAVAPLFAQDPKRPANPRPATTGAAKYTAPRTPWGAPDLTGLWSNATTTPLERPSGVSKERLSDEEFAKADKETAERRNTDRAPQKGDPGTYNEVWW